VPLVEVRNLSLEFTTAAGRTRVVDDVSLSIESGETLGLVGESGSGKSVTALSLARLIPTPPATYPAGEILVEGRDVLKMSKAELRAMRGGVVSYIFQDPSASLNPIFRIGSQILESLKLHRPEKATEAEVVRLLKLVGIVNADTRVRDYPHQLSGGMQQRVMIAMALASEPKLLVADEPTTALDVTIQAQIFDLLRDLKKRLGMAILLITHDLSLLTEIADRVAVMYAGQIVEQAPTRQILDAPRHPYTRGLLASVPEIGKNVDRLESIPGTVPSPAEFPTGCRFHPRCPQVQADCPNHPIPLLEPKPRERVRCHYWELNYRNESEVRSSGFSPQNAGEHNASDAVSNSQRLRAKARTPNP
jgi:oligopeptide transport system ATP-binding protein